MNDTHLIATDGSKNLFYIETPNLKIVKTVHTDININYLNDLTSIVKNGKPTAYVLVCQYQTPYIHLINIETGHVLKQFDFSKVIKEQEATFQQEFLHLSQNQQDLWKYDHNMNGIVQVSDDMFLVTGKNWDSMYYVKFNLGI